MTHLITEGDMDDLGLSKHGSELDIDIDPNKEVFKQPQMFVQMRKASDYPDGMVVKTDDGEEVKVSQGEAKFISQKGPKGLAPVFGIHPSGARDPDAEEAVMKELQNSKGLMKVLDLIRKK